MYPDNDAQDPARFPEHVIRHGVDSLSGFIQAMVQAGVQDMPTYKAWVADREAEMNEWFGYQREAGMPDIRSLVKPDFHETKPLILLNYTKPAHALLHLYVYGWTTQLRLCRGIIFDTTGRLIALPFVKFFNLNQDPETMYDALPDGVRWWAPRKYDGHLGIIFEYEGEWILTTRGRFTSTTAQIGQGMLDRYRSSGVDWDEYESLTLMVEMIHPETRIHLDYSREEHGFVLIGANNRYTLHDLLPDELVPIADSLGLHQAELWEGNDLDELVEHIGDRSVTNREGWVIRFENGLRVKIKYETYLAMMYAKQLSYRYLMARMVAGDLESRLEVLDDEVYDRAMSMLGDIMRRLYMPAPLLSHIWKRLYELQDQDVTESTFRARCREFVYHMKAVYMAAKAPGE